MEKIEGTKIVFLIMLIAISTITLSNSVFVHADKKTIIKTYLIVFGVSIFSTILAEMS